jgi:ribosome maturation factor RimP
MPATETSVESRIRALTDEVIAGTAFYLVDVDVRGAKGSRVVDVVLDSEAGPTLDELAEMSREVGFLVDTEELIDGSYDLNVSSPGADRPLRTPRQFKKNVGRDLFVTYRAENGAPDHEQPTLHGTLEEANDETITVAELKVSKDKEQRKSKTGHRERIAYDDVIEAEIELPW